MRQKAFKSAKFLVALSAYLAVCVIGFNFLILQQENVLRKYFITIPQEKIKNYNASLSNSLCKYFARENKSAGLNQAAAYLERYGRTSLFDLIFIFKDKDGRLKQITKSGISQVTKEALASESVYPVTIDNGAMGGYLLVIIKDTGGAELEEGFRKYAAITYSIRFLFLLLALALLAIVCYHTYSAKMRLARDLAEIRASNDGLTGLHTRDYFMKILEIEVERFTIYNTPVALLMLDIDRFKSFNDTFGHPAGDKVLQEAAKTIKANTRATDIVARYGGEEFAVIMPYVAKTNRRMSKKERLKVFVYEIRSVAERIRKSIEESEINFLSDKLSVRISIGAAFFYRKTALVASDYLLRKADGALYKAKHLGRNRVCIDYESTGFA